ncbi:MAG: trehalose-phosphatase [Gammaproteobacteria bacterium]
MSAPPTLSSPDAFAVFLDFDGTLVNIADRPELVHAPESLIAALRDTHRALRGALALVTGRSIASLDELLDPLRLPAAGVHGIEFRDDGGAVQASAAPVLPAWVHRRATELAAEDAGLLVEDKGHGIAVHFRQAPALERRVRDEVASISSRLGPDFTIQNGKMVVELRPRCASKGTAVERFMAQAPFAGRTPVFAGDDVTDEDAFRVVNSLGGYSIKVGGRQPDSAAAYDLADVAAVRNWLLPLTRKHGDEN